MALTAVHGFGVQTYMVPVSCQEDKMNCVSQASRGLLLPSLLPSKRHLGLLVM